MARYRIDKNSTGTAYISFTIEDYDDQVLISTNIDGDYSSVEIDRNDFLETIRTILEEND